MKLIKVQNKATVWNKSLYHKLSKNIGTDYIVFNINYLSLNLMYFCFFHIILMIQSGGRNNGQFQNDVMAALYLLQGTR